MIWSVVCAVLAGCPSKEGKGQVSRPPAPDCRGDPAPTTWDAGLPEVEAAFAKERRTMVARQMKRRDIRDPAVLAAMERVPRHRFVPRSMRRYAYADRPLPLGCRQTVSQPYIVALMTQLVKPSPAKKALDIGTGSGYQTAVLAGLVKHVYSVEIICELADTARARLAALGRKNVTIRCGDGYQGWAEHGPFDIIVVAAAPKEIPAPLIEQLAPGGRLVIPVGGKDQDLVVVIKDAAGKTQRHVIAPVRFVPMTGKAQ